MIDKGQWGGFGPGHRGYTPTLYEKCYGIFNDHRESGHRFNVSFERQCSLTVKCPRPGWGLPCRYRPGSTLFSFSGQPVLGCRVIWLCTGDALTIADFEHFLKEKLENIAKSRCSMLIDSYPKILSCVIKSKTASAKY